MVALIMLRILRKDLYRYNQVCVPPYSPLYAPFLDTSRPIINNTRPLPAGAIGGGARRGARRDRLEAGLGGRVPRAQARLAFGGLHRLRRPGLSHTIYPFISFRKSTPPQNR